MISLLLYVIVQSVAVNVAVQFASHSCPTEISAVLPKEGNKCTVVAVGGNSGIFMLPM